MMYMKNKKANWILVIILIILSIIILGYIIALKNMKGDVVATYLTKDSYKYAPIEFRENVYFPVGGGFPEANRTKPLGSLSRNKGGLLARIVFDEPIVGEKNDEEFTDLEVYQGYSMKYTKANKVEKDNSVKEGLEKYSKYMLYKGNISDENEMEKVLIDKEIVLQLEKLFGEIKYNIDDFSKYDEIYYVYAEPKIYIGTIFYNDKKLYYGNMNNLIEGDLYDKIMNIVEK
ncbi:hypothetical protein [Clostridium sp. ATCC 25772]|uniref:hypothetical protein n=1 Tax=Clostridium sp. ATCC 25772 TaxID=1676991 RepID=UPI0012FB3748|nr:hypothetical protein [Clostridium sp. ATCC 25772]